MKLTGPDESYIQEVLTLLQEEHDGREEQRPDGGDDQQQVHIVKSCCNATAQGDNNKVLALASYNV